MRDVSGLIAKIFLVDHTLLRDKKRHDTAGAIIGRIGDKTEATGGWEHAVVVTVIGRAIAGGVVTFVGSLGKHRPGRALGLAFFRFPIKSILFAWLADKPDRIRACRFSVVGGSRVVALGGDDTFAHIDGRQLIVAYAPVKNLLFACLPIPIPLVSLVREWDGQRPVVLPHLKCELAVVPGYKGMPFVVPLQESVSIGFVRHGIAGRDDLLGARAKDRSQLSRIAVAYRRDKSGKRFL